MWQHCNTEFDDKSETATDETVESSRAFVERGDMGWTCLISLSDLIVAQHKNGHYWIAWKETP